ncbi:SixA phosphatase family protein [Lysobacter brunescens]|uniref:SixA phosphatase family protein n=1 Tax=Lysobacter brunescens TaxID=262323 RepID=A0ABW2YEE9_9GAMM
MNRIATLLGILLVLAATGCAMPTERAAQTEAQGVVFVLVRHAEKAKDDPKDPTLSDAGMARANRLAESLAKQHVVAAYATAYRRTQLTAAPTARSHGLDVRTHDAGMPAVEFARQLRASHRTGTVLVVGHSNTIPELAGALCACPVAPMAEDEFDRRMDIRIDADDRATLAQRRD